MPGSYERINYALRPAKNMERKMLCDAFRRLSEFARVESYRYIGFGSTYFSDFTLFHKALGIKSTLSIERDVEKEQRFLFNKPFSCVKIEFGHSNAVLPTLDWDVRTILWLDYDEKLDTGALTDISFFSSKAIPGSVLVVTINAHPDDLDQNRLQLLKNRVGEEKVPADVGTGALDGWGLAAVSRRIINNEIVQTLNNRNGGRPSGVRIKYRQLFNFHYADDAKMLTVGGLLYDEGQEEIVGKCGFDNLLFYRSGDEPYRIEVPSLTFREIRHLNAQLPVDDPTTLEGPSIPQRDLKAYHQAYRYFPAFVDAEF